jgi:ribonuclease VapC
MSNATEEMVVDSSALIALMRNEPNFQAISKRISEAPRLLISAVSVIETRMVLTRWPPLAKKFDKFLELAGAQTVAADEAICLTAFEVFGQFGKGRHSAALNICDCISLATATVYGEPLLFVGDDFAKAGLTRLVEQ